MSHFRLCAWVGFSRFIERGSPGHQPQTRRSINQPKHQTGLVLSLAGVVGLLSLFLPIGRAGPQGISTLLVPVTTVGELRSGVRSPTLPETDQATPAGVSKSLSQKGRRSLQRPINRGLENRGLETAPTGLGRGAEGRTQAIKASAGQVVPEDSQADGALLGIQQTRATTYRYDDLNRLVEIIYADGTRITYSYDAAGNLMQTITRPR